MFLFLLFFILTVFSVGFVYFLIRKPESVKKYWKHALTILSGLLGLLGLGFLFSRESTSLDPVLIEKERELKSDLDETRMESDRKIEILKEEEAESLQEIEAISVIEDEEERLKKLAAMWNRRRGR